MAKVDSLEIRVVCVKPSLISRWHIGFLKTISIMNPHFNDFDCNNKFLFLMKSESYVLQNLMAECIFDLFQVRKLIIETIGNRTS